MPYVCRAAPCSEPPPLVTNGHRVFFGVRHGDRARFFCIEGYKLSSAKSQYLTCRYGQWEGPVPKCEESECLHYTTLHCITLHCVTLHCATLHCTTLYYTALHYIALHYTTLLCTTLHCTTLQCTALHHTTLHCSAHTIYRPEK